VTQTKKIIKAKLYLPNVCQQQFLVTIFPLYLCLLFLACSWGYYT